MRQLLGVNPKAKPAILAINDSEVAYVCGHNTVIYNTENKTYRFIQGKNLENANDQKSIKNRNYVLKHQCINFAYLFVF